MLSKNEIIKGKTMRVIPETQWTGIYDEIMPDGTWNLIYYKDGETVGIQMYEKGDTIIQFNFKMTNKEYDGILSVFEYTK